MIYQNIVESEDTLRFVFSGGVGTSSSSSSSSSSSWSPSKANSSSIKHLDSNAKDMILSLLRSSSNLRLGMWKNGINGIWEHPFLKGTVVHTFFLFVVFFVLSSIEFSFNVTLRYVIITILSGVGKKKICEKFIKAPFM